MADRFLNYDELAAQFEEGRDFGIEAIQKVGSRFTVLAPHGGKIERGTSEIARLIAGEQYNLYLFEGRLSAGNRDLHVTSHRFFEKRADDLLKATEFAIGVHGRRDQDDKVSVFLGGLDEALIALLEGELNEVGFLTSVSGHPFPAKQPANICNRCISGRGAQVEIPHSLRLRLLASPDGMACFVGSIHRALVASIG